MLKFLLLFSFFGVIFCLYSRSHHHQNHLIYILLDGFRYNYLDDVPPSSTPGFQRFLQEGVRAEWLKPIFPSISYPTWTSLATGLHAESHGIVGNYFYDGDEKDVFSLFDQDKTGKKKWWTAEPIWTTATKAGLKVANFLWSRCDVPFDEVTPDHCVPFVKIRETAIFKINVNKALQKLDEGFHFMMIYNEHTDNQGHDHGPMTEQRKAGVRKQDDIINYLQDELETRNMTNKVNIIIVSDHGMTDVATGRVTRVELDDYLPLAKVEKITDAGAFSNIKVMPGEGNIKQVYDELKKMPGVDVHLHNEIPERLHFKNHKYIHDILVKARIGTWILKSGSSKMVPLKSDYVYKGAHGYDPDAEDMRGIFFAKGPDFKKNVVIPEVRVVDVYQLLAHLLEVQPMVHNGTWDRVKPALLIEPDEPSVVGSASQLKSTLICFLVVLFCQVAGR